MQIDAYAATIHEHPSHLVEALCAGLHGEPRNARGMHGYTQGWEIASRGSGDVLARVLAGGRNPHPHAWAQGDDAQGFAQLVRDTWPGAHHVTRIDAAQDFEAPGTYERLRDLFRGVISAKRIRGREIVPEDLDEGRTFYGGAPSSDLRVRLYEKGKQLRAQLPPGLQDNISPDRVRLEAQARPQKEARVFAASCTPEQVWGFSAWTQELAHQAMDLDVPRVVGRSWRESDDDRAFRFMIRQYGPLLQRLEQDLGSWCVVGKTIGAAIQDAHHKEES